MKKKVLSLALALAMCLGLLPITVSATTVTEAIPCQYTWGQNFSEGLALIRESDEQEYFIDKTGAKAISLDGSPRGSFGFSEGLAGVGKKVGNDYKCGYIDKTGAEIIPYKYDDVNDFSGDLAIVEFGEFPNSKPGCIDKTGREIVSCDKYDGMILFNDFIWVRIDNRRGIVDRNGVEIAPCIYDDVGSEFDKGFSNGMITVKRDGKWGFVNRNGQEVIPCKYDRAHEFSSNGLARVQLEGKEGLIDKTGKEVVPCKYSYIRDFSDGLAIVAGNGFGVINESGEEVVPCKYSGAADGFSEGLAAVKVGEYYRGEEEKWGYIDKTGTEVIPCNAEYIYANNFSEGLACVIKKAGGENREIVYLNKDGTEAFSLGTIYESAADFLGGTAAVRRNGKRGYIDKTGQEVIPCRYDAIGKFYEGFAPAQIDGKWGCIDKNGAEIIPFKYDYMDEFFDGAAKVGVKTGKKVPIGMDEIGDEVKYGYIVVDGVSAVPTTNTAYVSTQTVLVDGKLVTFLCYALKDADGNPTNYIKLRDLALILNGSPAQFQVGWDGAVTITTKTTYTPNGSELSTPFSGDRAYIVPTTKTNVDGQTAQLDAIVLTDDAGGAYTYYKLRDLGAAIGFQVDWSPEKGIFIETQ